MTTFAAMGKDCYSERCRRCLHSAMRQPLARRRTLVPPTGNRVEITGITIERFAGRKIVEDSTNYDALGLL